MLYMDSVINSNWEMLDILGMDSVLFRFSTYLRMA